MRPTRDQYIGVYIGSHWLAADRPATPQGSSIRQSNRYGATHAVPFRRTTRRRQDRRKSYGTTRAAPFCHALRLPQARSSVSKGIHLSLQQETRGNLTKLTRTYAIQPHARTASRQPMWQLRTNITTTSSHHALQCSSTAKPCETLSSKPNVIAGSALAELRRCGNLQGRQCRRPVPMAHGDLQEGHWNQLLGL